ncbi:MAG: chemotaxis protein CheD [Sediminispirochaetaceae bacterium]
MRLDVGIGEWKVSNRPEDELKTYALGSCVGVCAYDTINRVGGLMHIALPYSEINPKKADLLPGYFADTGLPLFFNDLKEMGAERLYTWIKLVGGSSMLDYKRRFDIGKRNVNAIRDILAENWIQIKDEDTGGDYSRTVSLFVNDGRIVISNSGEKWEI